METVLNNIKTASVSAAKILKLVAVAWILVLLTLPAVQMYRPILDLQHEELREQRNKARAPTWPNNKKELQQIPSKFDSFFADNFGFRDLFVQLNNTIQWHVFDLSPIQRLLKGKENWLFFTGKGALEFYSGKNRFKPKSLERFAEILQARQDFLDSIGVKYIYFLVPQKEAIYPEFLPSGIPAPTEETRYEQVVRYLRAHTTVTVVDPREALKAKKNPIPIYRLSDNHWNSLGAYVGYEQIFNVMKSLFPQLLQTSLDRYEFVQSSEVGELGKMLGLYKSPRFPMIDLQDKQADRWLTERVSDEGDFGALSIDRSVLLDGKTDISTDKLPSLMVYRDSFFSRITPFISKNFIRSSYFSTHTSSFDPIIIEQERPAVVIDETIERYLHIPHGEELKLIKERLSGKRYSQIGKTVQYIPEATVSESGYEISALTLGREGRTVLEFELAQEISEPTELKVFFARKNHNYRKGDFVRVSAYPRMKSPIVAALSKPERINAIKIVSVQGQLKVKNVTIVALERFRELPKGVKLHD